MLKKKKDCYNNAVISSPELSYLTSIKKKKNCVNSASSALSKYLLFWTVKGVQVKTSKCSEIIPRINVHFHFLHKPYLPQV